MPERTDVAFTGDGDTRTVVKSPVPAVVQNSIAARDEYAEFVPPQRDLQKNTLKYRFYSAETYFLYGQFPEAQTRFEALYREECGKSDVGYKAWEKLITMSNLERNADRSRMLAEAEKQHSCAVTESDKASASLIVNPTLQEAAYVMARRKFEEARKAPPGDQKNKLWREAAGLYEAALQAAPARDEAPEAAMNAAYAYKQVGEYGKAIAMYDKFIAEYGSETRMAALEKGDPKAKVAPDPKRYEERLKFLNDAYDALGTTYYSFFNYGKAAETYERVAKNERFPVQKRKDGAKNAMTLYASMGDKDQMLGAYRVYSALKPTAEEQLSADYLVAAYEFHQWTPAGADTGENKQHRTAAQDALGSFYNKNANSKAGGRYVTEAAYLVAKMRKTGGENPTTWWKNTIAAWDRFKATSPAGADGKSDAMKAPYVDYAAEADFTLVDQQIAAKYDDPARHKYTGSVADVLGTYDVKTGKLTKPGKYQTNANDADKWDRELERIVKAYPSVEWVPTALARRGTLWDELRTGLYNATPPAIKYFTPQQEKLLKQLEDSGRPELQDKADALRDTAREGWRTKKESELSGADNLMVRNYASSVYLARKYNVRSDYVSKAIGRLAYFTDIIGDAKLRGVRHRHGRPDRSGQEARLQGWSVPAEQAGPDRGAQGIGQGHRAADHAMKTSSNLWAFSFALGAAVSGASLSACAKKKPAATAGTNVAGSGSPAGPGLASPGGDSSVANIDSSFGTPDEKTDLTGSAKSDYEKGFEAWSRGDLKTARDKYKDAQGEAPKSGAPGYALGIVLDRMGDAAGADAAFRQAYGANPKADRAVYAEAMLLANNKSRLGEAETFLTGQIARNPTSPRLTTAMAEVKSLQGDHTSAQKLAQDALRLNPDFKEAMVEVARDHYRAGKIELARYALSAVLDGVRRTPPRPATRTTPTRTCSAGLLERDMGAPPGGIRGLRRGGQAPARSGRSAGADRLDAARGGQRARRAPAPRERGALRPEERVRPLEPRRLLPPPATAGRRQTRDRHGAHARLVAGGGALRPRPLVPVHAQVSGPRAGQTGASCNRRVREIQGRAAQVEWRQGRRRRAHRPRQSQASRAQSPGGARSVGRAGTRRGRFRCGGSEEEVVRKVGFMHARSLFVGLVLFTLAGTAAAQRKSSGGPITIGEITIVGRVPKPVAAVDVSKIQPKLALAELKQPFLERIEAATKRDPF